MIVHTFCSPKTKQGFLVQVLPGAAENGADRISFLQVNDGATVSIPALMFHGGDALEFFLAEGKKALDLYRAWQREQVTQMLPPGVGELRRIEIGDPSR
jgi:hypothetical protein